jgi:PIN domain nuclease of toxin-antitoxin system
VRLLLDTNVLIWAVSEPERMGGAFVDAIATEANQVFVSAVSAWEISIKIGLGKLRFPTAEASWLRDRVSDLGAISWLPVTPTHGWQAGLLPLLHKDPFDRLLIAQARLEALTLVTSDRDMTRYDVSILPA